MLQALIDHGADVNATNKDNLTALMLACMKKRGDAIHVLLAAGSDANIGSILGQTCLMCAVQELCSKEVLQAIIDHGADVNATNKYNFTALIMACEQRNEDAITVLLQAGADPNCVYDKGAAYLFHVDVGDAGTDTYIVDKNGRTCLMCAVNGHCSKEVLQAIINHGADVNATDGDNSTALMLACEKRHVDAIHVLLKAGSDTNIVDKDGRTCLMCAVRADSGEKVLQAIIDHGADVNATNKYCSTALMLACGKRHAYAINVLLKAGSDTNIVEKNGRTCLMYAVHEDCSKEVLQTIIDHGADVNAIGKGNITPLSLASKKSNIDTIKLLLGAGAEPTIDIYSGLLAHYN